MIRGRDRHPAFEIAVFAAALLLAVFVARELWRRHQSAPPAAAAANPPAADPKPSRVAIGTSERSVSSVPRVRLTRIERRKPKPRAVPAP